eukprot:1845371-Pleurochrysis_carterae.AAC.4
MCTFAVCARDTVMRLCKPIFGFSLPVPFSSLQGDAPKEHNGSTDMLQQADDGDLSPDLEHIGCAITGALMLPQSFGDIFLGETFSCYVSLTNISSAELCQARIPHGKPITPLAFSRSCKERLSVIRVCRRTAAWRALPLKRRLTGSSGSERARFGNPNIACFSQVRMDDGAAAVILHAS